MKRLKVLVSAYACEPDKGSEPGVGWNWVNQIARFCETWVITRENNRNSIEAAMTKGHRPDLHFVYYDLPSWMSFWKRGPKRMHLYYLLWQAAIWKIARELHGREKFHLVHHITFGSIFLPTFLPMFPVPFIWGPLGGAERVPRTFRRTWRVRPRLKEAFRDLLVKTLRANPLFLLACRKAVVIFSKTEESACRIPVQYRAKVAVATDVGVFLHSFSGAASGTDSQQVLMVGSLEAWRGFDLAIRAFAAVAGEFTELRLVIVGDGAERARLAQLCHGLGIEDKVLFAGKVSQAEYRDYLAESAIVMNPCMKEGGVTVLFDALLSGKPVICLDVAGSSQIVTDECGMRVRLSTPEVTVAGLGKALATLASDRILRERMGEAGRILVSRQHGWDRKGEFIRRAYEGIELAL
ncbi:MAG: glycosyltransferase family 4 protein [Candidatus Sulfobium sp.]|jgi:glycosyltransferase involved in cell wall biosynthesis